MSKTPARRSARPSVNPNLVVYAVAAVLLAAVALLLFNIFRPTGPGAKVLQWAEPPAMLIDTNKTYLATLKLDKGDIVIQLLPQVAPIAVNNFVFLARQGFYDGTTFHRVLSGFMAQGGDPTGTGGGGPGYEFQDEFSADVTFDQAGMVAMANSGPNTNGSQFFITYAPEPHLTGVHTIFGVVLSGMDVAEALTLRDPAVNPLEPGDKINTVVIDEQ
jgi:cyclophilin family peptidyl-prolyl cis-trans isomerase